MNSDCKKPNILKIFGTQADPQGVFTRIPGMQEHQGSRS